MAKKRLNLLPKSENGNILVISLIAVMTYLAAIVGVAGFLIYNTSQNWQDELKNMVTVQIAHQEAAEQERQQNIALEILRQTPGVAKAEPMSREELVALLEPWLGAGNITTDIPIPAMIAVELDPNAFFNKSEVERRLANEAPNASIDDHQQWMGQLNSLVKGLQAAVLFSLILISVSTAVIIIFATQSRLTTHRDTIDILHLIGSEDGMIASEFRRYFFSLGFKGGLVGLMLSFITFFGLQYLAKQANNFILPDLSLVSIEFTVLLLIPIMASVLSMLTAEVTVRRTLGKTL